MIARGCRRLEIESALRPKELLAAVFRTCPLAGTWRGVGEVRVEPYGRGETALGLAIGATDRAPHAVFRAAVHPCGERAVLVVSGLERRGRPWGPWRRRADRGMYRRFLDAVAAEVARADPTAANATG